MLLLKMFSRKWILATLFVLAGTALCVRLGIWQLDRLAQRRVFNAQFLAARAMSPLDLNATQTDDLTHMEWRPVQVTGEYDFENQVALRNQYYGDQYGYHLLTPLLFSGKAVLVDRGFIPADGNSAPADWRKYDEPGTLTIKGQIRLGQTKPAFGGVADALPENGTKLGIWNNADITHIANQLPYPILPVLIQPDMDASDTEPPIPYQPEVEISEGPHFGYALQWFTFATILFVGYPFFLRKQEMRSK
jgi:surfeit locus 1 family protein